MSMLLDTQCDGFVCQGVEFVSIGSVLSQRFIV